MNKHCFATILVALFIAGTHSSAQRIQTALSVFDNQNLGSVLFFGLDANATDGIDTALAESEFPPQHPGSGMHAALQLPPPIDWSYRDYRKLTQEPVIVKEFRIEVQYASQRGNTPIVFKWEYPLAKGIDSIVIVDRKSNGLRAKFALDAKRRFEVNDDISDSFLARAYYRNSPSDVAEEAADKSGVFPNPAGEFITISGISAGESLAFVTIGGNVLPLQPSDTKRISVAGLPPGVYGVCAVSGSVMRYIGTFVKQ